VGNWPPAAARLPPLQNAPPRGRQEITRRLSRLLFRNLSEPRGMLSRLSLLDSWAAAIMW
jgi:hypothetical protein